jgi:hypothetical protein
MAAIQSARLGRKVALLENSYHIGGMTTGGLSWTDFGNKAAIGGIAREFYRSLGMHYLVSGSNEPPKLQLEPQRPDSWRGIPEEWNFEPHAAERTLEWMIEKASVPAYRRQFLKSVRKLGPRILSITTENGLTVHAGMFIDASYEGDLMARAGLSFTVGREGNAKYGETINGVQIRGSHQFDRPVDPYVKPGDPTSGLLPGVNPSVGPTGTGDKRIQAYNFRLCLTREPDNRIRFAKPRNYRRDQYELLARHLAAGWNEIFRKFDPIRGSKFDKNNHGSVSTDFIGMNYGWPEGSYSARERLFQEHVDYVMDWFWFLCTDPAVPADIRTKMNEYGLCKDEFTDTDGWSRQLYVREARRMVSDVVMNENHCRGKTVVEDSVGLGSYGMDSHNCQRVVVDGSVKNEGDVQVAGFPPYPVSYRAITPRKKECENLFVPICLSASHIAYGSIRMEPVFMVLGQSTALAADIALKRNVAVQDVPYDELRRVLLEAGQVLEWRPGGGQSH